jgi:hypothetical protein
MAAVVSVRERVVLRFRQRDTQRLAGWHERGFHQA